MTSRTNRRTANRLLALTNARYRILAAIAASCFQSGCHALLSVGSLGSGGGDEFSDLDLIAVPADLRAGLNLTLVGERVLARFHDPAHAPRGGWYSAVCLAAADALVWVDLYGWPRATAAVPADATTVYSRVDLPQAGQGFVPFINAHLASPTGDRPDPTLRLLAQTAVAAKYLARNNIDRLSATMPAVTDLDGAVGQLTGLVTAVRGQAPAGLVWRTLRLITLADHARRRPHRPTLAGATAVPALRLIQAGIRWHHDLLPLTLESAPIARIGAIGSGGHPGAES